MTPGPARDDARLALETFPSLRVLVLGDAMLDAYLDGRTERLCREAPVPVVEVGRTASAPGGAANTALNVASLGASVAFLSVTGDDAEALTLREALSSAGVDVTPVIAHPGRRTIAKRRVLACGQMLLRLDDGDTGDIDDDTASELARRFETLYGRADAVIVSDYGYGLVTAPIVSALARLQHSSPRTLVVDSRRLPRYRDVGITAAKPNYAETLRLLGDDAGGEPGASRAGRMAAYGERVLDVTGARVAAVTLDTDGAVVFERGAPPYRTYARPAPDSHAAGAGDSFTAALTLSLAAGATTPVAAEIASVAGSVVVARDGTTTCSLAELRGAFDERERRPLPPAAVERALRTRRCSGESVVLANGCFDILHRGHIDFLNRAKALGDVLVVGVNTDESVRRLRGTGRPVNPLEDRMRVLSALSCVDYLVPFSEDTAAGLVEGLRPDVLAKGADHDPATLPEAAAVRAIGGRVEILSLWTGASTSGVIGRILATRDDAAG